MGSWLTSETSTRPSSSPWPAWSPRPWPRPMHLGWPERHGEIRPGPPIPESHRRPGRLRLRRHPLAGGDGGGRDDRRHRGAHRGRGRRLHPARRRTASLGRGPRRAGEAIALIDQWGVGRAGFDDGLAIFFDIDPSLEHGQVQLYAAPGFEAAFLTNSERQAIFEDDMLPHLRSADFDAALAVALDKVDAAATPENANKLQAPARSTRSSASSARRSSCSACPAGPSSTGAGSARTRSTSTTRRS